MHLQILSLLAALAFSVLADVEVTSPPAGKSIAAGTIAIAWKDSGKSPSISDLTTYSINLCAGGSEQDTFSCTLATLQTGATFAQGSTTSADVPAAAGDNSANGYFLQFVSTSSTGGTVTNYSSRFGMKGMTGKFPAQVEKGMKTVGTKAKQGPPTENDAASKESVGANGPYAMPFSMQTGLTKYAPMQPQPPTKISMKTVSPQYPPSNVPIAQKNMAPPSQVTTVTQTQTYSVSSMENTASPLSMPQDPMQKFLNRWKD